MESFVSVDRDYRIFQRNQFVYLWLGHRIFDWDIESLAVENAYLEAPLDHETYMNLPIELFQEK
jgi:hypothetical protein